MNIEQQNPECIDIAAQARAELAQLFELDLFTSSKTILAILEKVHTGYKHDILSIMIHIGTINNAIGPGMCGQSVNMDLYSNIPTELADISQRFQRIKEDLKPVLLYFAKMDAHAYCKGSEAQDAIEPVINFLGNMQLLDSSIRRLQTISQERLPRAASAPSTLPSAEEIARDVTALKAAMAGFGETDED